MWRQSLKRSKIIKVHELHQNIKKLIKAGRISQNMPHMPKLENEQNIPKSTNMKPNCLKMKLGKMYDDRLIVAKPSKMYEVEPECHQHIPKCAILTPKDGPKCSKHKNRIVALRDISN